MPVPGRAAVALDLYLAEARPELVKRARRRALPLPPRRPAEPRRPAGDRAAARPRDRRRRLSARAAAHLRDASPAGRRRHPPRPGAARPPLPRDDGALHAGRHRGPAPGPRPSAPAAVGRDAAMAVRSAVLGPSPTRDGKHLRGGFAVARTPTTFPLIQMEISPQRPRERTPGPTRGTPRTSSRKVEKNGAEQARFALRPAGQEGREGRSRGCVRLLVRWSEHSSRDRGQRDYK